MAATDFERLWNGATPFDDFLHGSVQHKGLWEGIYRLARLPDWSLDVRPEGIHLLVMAEDWCGDAANTIPVLAKWADQVEGLDLRLIHRDEHSDLMERYLTNGSRSIPIVIVLDENFCELGYWGPRPGDLQNWVVDHLDVPSRERYPEVRRWYARDRGVTTLCEVAQIAGLAVAEMCG